MQTFAVNDRVKVINGTARGHIGRVVIAEPDATTQIVVEIYARVRKYAAIPLNSLVPTDEPLPEQPLTIDQIHECDLFRDEIGMIWEVVTVGDPEHPGHPVLMYHCEPDGRPIFANWRVQWFYESQRVERPDSQFEPDFSDVVALFAGQ